MGSFLHLCSNANSAGTSRRLTRIGNALQSRASPTRRRTLGRDEAKSGFDVLLKKQLQVAGKQTEVGGNRSVYAACSQYKEVDTMSFGENLQLIRKKNQLSQEGLAEMLGVSRQTVSK